MSIKIVEIKAKCPDPGMVKGKLAKMKAIYKGTDYQTDRYYEVKIGRFKLRKGNIENSLIHYLRPNDEAPKKSEVQFYSTTDVDALGEVLDAGLESWVTVKKEREIYFIDHTKIHIDMVEGLGCFIEIEVIDSENSLELKEMHETCNIHLTSISIHVDQN